jgi:hypothetical protein
MKKKIKKLMWKKKCNQRKVSFFLFVYAVLERKLPKKQPHAKEDTPKKPTEKKKKKRATSTQPTSSKKQKKSLLLLPAPTEEEIKKFSERKKTPKRPQSIKETPEQKQKREAVGQLEKFGGSMFNVNPFDLGRPPPVVMSRSLFGYHVENSIRHFSSLGENVSRKNFYIAVGNVSFLFFVL